MDWAILIFLHLSRESLIRDRGVPSLICNDHPDAFFSIESLYIPDTTVSDPVDQDLLCSHYLGLQPCLSPVVNVLSIRLRPPIDIVRYCCTPWAIVCAGNLTILQIEYLCTPTGSTTSRLLH